MKPVLAILVVLAAVSACGGESEAHKAAREDAHAQAGYYCSLDPSIGSIYSDAFKNCVKQQEAVLMSEWESEHPKD